MGLLFSGIAVEFRGRRVVTVCGFQDVGLGLQVVRAGGFGVFGLRLMSINPVGLHVQHLVDRKCVKLVSV